MTNQGSLDKLKGNVTYAYFCYEIFANIQQRPRRNGGRKWNTRATYSIEAKIWNIKIYAARGYKSACESITEYNIQVN